MIESRIFGLIGNKTHSICQAATCNKPPLFYLKQLGVLYCGKYTIDRISLDLSKTKEAYDQALLDADAVKEYLKDRPELGLEI
ncbi:MAG TPA: hypothetical protein VNX68_10345 [Nitrosopumilaceae archaeon]|jgi:hypothetical protein|nr:hypothetical protein [Nitrosopumilaceae archaeon]